MIRVIQIEMDGDATGFDVAFTEALEVARCEGTHGPSTETTFRIEGVRVKVTVTRSKP